MSTVFTAKVQNGVIVAEGVDLPEGATVTVLLDDATTYTPTPEELVEIDASIAEADRDEVIPWHELRARLRPDR